MISYKTYPAPNIVSGCNLDESLINELYAWINASIADAGRFSSGPDRFGLYCMSEHDPVDIEIVNYKIRIYQCQATTPMGSGICQIKGIHECIECDIDAKVLSRNSYTYIMLGISHKERRAFGPQSQDFPLRRLHASSKVQVSLENDEGGAFNKDLDKVPIARMVGEGDGLQLDEEYIPPVYFIGGHKVTTKKLYEYQKACKKLYESSIGVIRRNQDFSNKAQLDLRELGFTVGRFVSQHQNSYLSLNQKSELHQMLQFWIDLASVVHFSLRSLQDRQEFNTLLAHNMRHSVGKFGVGEFNGTLRVLSSTNYDPYQLTSLVQLVNEFISQLIPLFNNIGEGMIDLHDPSIVKKDRFTVSGPTTFNPNPESF